METNIKHLLSLSEDELLFRLGNDLVGTSARSEPRGALIQKAKEWLSNRSDDFRAAICSSAEVRAIRAMSPADDREVQLVAAVSDVLSTILVGIPPFTISVLLIRVGLDNLCKD